MPKRLPNPGELSTKVKKKLTADKGGKRDAATKSGLGVLHDQEIDEAYPRELRKATHRLIKYGVIYLIGGVVAISAAASIGIVVLHRVTPWRWLGVDEVVILEDRLASFMVIIAGVFLVRAVESYIFPSSKK